jgi:hypothetical protein
MTLSARYLAPALAGALLLSLPWPAHADQQETERVDRTAQIRAGGTLKLKNFSGHVHINGSNRADVSLRAVRHATRDRLDHIKLDVQENGSDVVIEANKKDNEWHDRDNNVVDTEFDIDVPADVAIEIDVFSSDVTVKDVHGNQHVKTFSGAIDLSGGEKAISAGRLRQFQRRAAHRHPDDLPFVEPQARAGRHRRRGDRLLLQDLLRRRADQVAALVTNRRRISCPLPAMPPDKLFA